MNIWAAPSRGEDAAPIVPSAGAGAPLLSDGRRLALRQICPADRDGLAALFARLSPESRRRRFLGPNTELTDAELTFLTYIDHVCHQAIAAIDQRDCSIVGVLASEHTRATATKSSMCSNSRPRWATDQHVHRLALRALGATGSRETATQPSPDRRPLCKRTGRRRSSSLTYRRSPSICCSSCTARCCWSPTRTPRRSR